MPLVVVEFHIHYTQEFNVRWHSMWERADGAGPYEILCFVRNEPSNCNKLYDEYRPA